MSGHSYSDPCPVCENQMDKYSDYKPFDYVSGLCVHCGFSYYTKTEQATLEEINERRAEYEPPLPPLKKKDLTKWKEEIKNLF